MHLSANMYRYITLYVQNICIYIHACISYSIAPSAIHKQSVRYAAKMLLKGKAKLSTLLALRQLAECYIVHMVQARQSFNGFKEFITEYIH